MRRAQLQTATNLAVLTITTTAFLCIVLVLFALSKNEILPADVATVLTPAAKAFAVPLAVIVGGVSGAKAASRKAVAAGVALLVLGWCGIMLWQFITFVTNDSVGVDAVVAFCTSLSNDWSFLISGSLAFLLGAKSKG